MKFMHENGQKNSPFYWRALGGLACVKASCLYGGTNRVYSISNDNKIMKCRGEFLYSEVLNICQSLNDTRYLISARKIKIKQPLSFYLFHLLSFANIFPFLSFFLSFFLSLFLSFFSHSPPFLCILRESSWSKG